VDEVYILARQVLLDALEALGSHRLMDADELAVSCELLARSLLEETRQ
jgi:hypothetical protein